MIVVRTCLQLHGTLLLMTALSVTSSLSGGQAEQAFGGRREFPLGHSRAQSAPDLVPQQPPPPRPPLVRVARPPRLVVPRRRRPMPDKALLFPAPRPRLGLGERPEAQVERADAG